MKPTVFFALVAGTVLAAACATRPLSALVGAENSVVAITAEVEAKPLSPFSFLFTSRRSPLPTPPEIEVHLGTGFAMNGRIYTCEHVIHGARTIYVTLRDGRFQWARLLRSDRASDLAELQIGDMPPGLALRSYPPRLYERVWQIGNPADLRWVVTSGIFLTFDGKENRFIIDTWLGNSGSPLMDVRGRVVGMTHNIIRGTRFTGGGTLQELVNFSQPQRPR